jgi:hypothetical protein
MDLEESEEFLVLSTPVVVLAGRFCAADSASTLVLSEMNQETTGTPEFILSVMCRPWAGEDVAVHPVPDAQPGIARLPQCRGAPA